MPLDPGWWHRFVCCVRQPIQANAVKNLWQNVWRKRKEKETANMLSHERNKSKAMDEELVGLRKQVESLKSQARPSLCVCVV